MTVLLVVYVVSGAVTLTLIRPCLTYEAPPPPVLGAFARAEGETANGERPTVMLGPLCADANAVARFAADTAKLDPPPERCTFGTCTPPPGFARCAPPRDPRAAGAGRVFVLDAAGRLRSETAADAKGLFEAFHRLVAVAAETRRTAK